MKLYGKLDKYTFKIVRIICLTNIPAILTLPWFFEDAIGWILGTIGSIIRFIWLSQQVNQFIDNMPSKAKVNSIKGFYFRFIFIIVYSVLIVWLVKPNIIMFGVGLLSSQLAIYVNEIYSRIKR